MGANVMLIFPGVSNTGGVRLGTGTTVNLTPKDYEAILRECPAVRSAAPIVRARAQVIYGNRNWIPGQITGTTEQFLDVREWTSVGR